MGVKCFWAEPNGRVKQQLRRYRASDERCAVHPLGFHNGSTFLQFVTVDNKANLEHIDPSIVPYDDPRWPTACVCGMPFTDDDQWQIFQERMFSRPDTGEEWEQRDLPPGAMFNAFWLDDIPRYTGPDGLALTCILPDGSTWHVDSEANNCTRKGDETHKCWVRHGTIPNITVDKSGNTCSAGAGSILSPGGKYHGFLQNGILT